jgi:hypothetical protein
MTSVGQLPICSQFSIPQKSSGAWSTQGELGYDARTARRKLHGLAAVIDGRR